MRIVLIGATGLVGRLLLPRLAAAGHEVHALQRHAAADSPVGATVHVAEAEEWPALVTQLAPEAAVSALGTTMRRAGSEAAFAAVDRDMVLDFAAAARAAGASRFATVSSAGADPASRNFYLRLKGEVEQALRALAYPRLDIFRPGLLRGPRGNDRRLGERIGIAVSPLVNLLLRGPLGRYAAIDATQVATAICDSMRDRAPGVFVHHNLQIGRRG
jgi:uncharacterized protein YbjT (DUF2867 family)